MSLGARHAPRIAMTAVFNRIGPYDILREIGRGGMAVVFLATDTRTAQRVALKLVPDGTDREAREIFEAERWGAELQKQFCGVSSCVPTVYEYGVESGYFYVAMEYLDGENLSEVITRGPLHVGRAVAIASDLCRFLEDAHAFEVTVGDQKLRSLLHGDLTSRNVRITSAKQVKVLDFGIAKALSLSRKVTRNDFGSRAYLSPERLESGVVDGYADFWAVGVLLYEMVRGEAPFQAPDTRRLEQRITSRRPPQSLDGRCPIGLQAVVAKLLAPHQDERYENARVIREDLERYASGATTQAEQEGWPGRAADEAATRRTHPVAAVDQQTTRRTSNVDGPQAAAPVVPPIPTMVGRRWLPTWVLSQGRRLRTALLLLVLLTIVNEFWVARAASRVTALVPTRELDGLADVWNEYDALSRRSYLRLGTISLERSLTQQTATLADRVIANYRAGLSTVRERQWTTARDALARAVAAAPDEQRLRAALRYCEGQLHRINGDARKERNQNVAAQQEFADAVAAFREAAQLRPKWPDPFLGLARTFISGLGDVDRGADALEQARRLGYVFGDRETVQLADGYRERGDALARNAKQLTDLPQEHENLSRAVEVYQRALDLYSKIVHIADVPRKMRVTQRSLDQVRWRLDGLSQSTGTGDAPQNGGSSTEVTLEERPL